MRRHILDRASKSQGKKEITATFSKRRGSRRRRINDRRREEGWRLEVNKNRCIEDWNAARENLEHNFPFTLRSLAVISLFGLTVPILVSWDAAYTESFDPPDGRRLYW